jgi:hypothetical protein
VFAAVEACDDHVGFSPLLDAHTTVYAWVNKAFTMPADKSAVLNWQAKPGAHSYFSRNFGVTLRQLRLFMNSFLCETKKNVDAFHGYTFGFVHFCEGAPRYVVELKHISIDDTCLGPHDKGFWNLKGLFLRCFYNWSYGAFLNFMA